MSLFSLISGTAVELRRYNYQNNGTAVELRGYSYQMGHSSRIKTVQTTNGTAAEAQDVHSCPRILHGQTVELQRGKVERHCFLPSLSKHRDEKLPRDKRVQVSPYVRGDPFSNILAILWHTGSEAEREREGGGEGREGEGGGGKGRNLPAAVAKKKKKKKKKEAPLKGAPCSFPTSDTWDT